MYVSKMFAQKIPERWFGLVGSIRLDARYWNRVCDKLIKAGHLDFTTLDDEVVERAIALVEGEDAGQRRSVTIQRVINNTPPGQKRPPPRKAETRGTCDGVHRGLGPAPVILNAGIRDTGPEKMWAPRIPASLLKKPAR